MEKEIIHYYYLWTVTNRNGLSNKFWFFTILFGNFPVIDMLKSVHLKIDWRWMFHLKCFNLESWEKMCRVIFNNIAPITNPTRITSPKRGRVGRLIWVMGWVEEEFTFMNFFRSFYFMFRRLRSKILLLEVLPIIFITKI